MTITPKTTADFWILYSQYLTEHNPKIIRLARTAFFRYTLPGYGIPWDGSVEEALEKAKQIPTPDFADALNFQQKTFEQLGTKKSLQRNNRHRLKQMLDWCCAQDWWTTATRQHAHNYNPLRQRTRRIAIAPKTAADLWILYYQYLTEHNPEIIGLAKTAFFRYTLPGYGIPFDSSVEETLKKAKQIPAHNFVDALDFQQKAFEQLGAKKSLQRGNRHRLKQMLDWCRTQDWWKTATRENAHLYSPRRRNNLGNAHHLKLTDRKTNLPYGLDNLKSGIRQPKFSEDRALIEREFLRIEKELEKLKRFLTGIQVYKRQGKKMRGPTYNKVQRFLYLIFGWLYFEEDKPLTEIGLTALDDIQIAYEYTEWGRTERQISPKTELQALVALTHVAKFNHHQESDEEYCSKLNKSYVDIKIINQLRKLLQDTNDRIDKNQKPVADESKKWLDWPDFLACINYLKEDCQSFTSTGNRRDDRTVAANYQRYLIAAMLAYMPPDRQRTFRELRVGRTLIKGKIKGGNLHPDENGTWFINLTPDDYKTGAAYGDFMIQLPEILHPPIEEWLTQWRGILQPKHNFVFTQLNGKPLSGSSLHHLFQHAIYRASTVLFGQGKATNPHLVRDMLVTYCYESGASEAEMDGLAIAMKHSRRTQREQYDRRSKQTKIDPAIELMKKFKPSERIESDENQDPA